MVVVVAAAAAAAAAAAEKSDSVNVTRIDCVSSSDCDAIGRSAIAAEINIVIFYPCITGPSQYHTVPPFETHLGWSVDLSYGDVLCRGTSHDDVTVIFAAYKLSGALEYRDSGPRTAGRVVLLLLLLYYTFVDAQ